MPDLSELERKKAREAYMLSLRKGAAGKTNQGSDKTSPKVNSTLKETLKTKKMWIKMNKSKLKHMVSTAWHRRGKKKPTWKTRETRNPGLVPLLLPLILPKEITSRKS